MPSHARPPSRHPDFEEGTLFAKLYLLKRLVLQVSPTDSEVGDMTRVGGKGRSRSSALKIRIRRSPRLIVRVQSDAWRDQLPGRSINCFNPGGQLNGSSRVRISRCRLLQEYHDSQRRKDP